MSATTAQPAEMKSTLPAQVPIMFLVYGFTGSLNTVSFAYMMYFCTEFAGLNAGAIAAFLSVARIVDLVVSLVSGSIVQRSNTKIGEYRPWVLGCCLCTYAGATLMFLNPPTSTTIKMIIVCVTYMMLHIPMNFLTVAQNGLVAKICGPNPANRLQIASMRLRGSTATRIFTSATVLPLIEYLVKMGHNGYFYVNLFMGLFAIIGVSIVFVVSKKYDLYVPDKMAVTGANPITQWKDALGIKQLWVLWFSDVIRTVAGQVPAACAIYYYRYSAGNVLLQALAATISSFVSLGATIVAPMMAKKIGKKNSHLFASFSACVLYLVIAFFADGNPVLYIACTLVNGVCATVLTSYGINLYLDVAEIRLLETGVDNRPFIMSINNIPIKLGLLASGPALAIMLNLGGYDGVAQVMPNTALFVRWFGIVPSVMYAAAFLLMLFFYRVKESEAVAAAAANAEAAKARAEAAAARQS
ncbi:MAG: MFS transporter [Oscillospiraceae bacterium]|nr:MFS transporter [Oscillospiraceae bacterium]